MTSANDQVMEIVRANLDPATAKIIEDAMGEAARISIIRDAFLEGRDVEAVKMLRDLDPIGIRKILGCRAHVPVPSGSTVQVTTRPQLPFTANRFVVSVSCASSFLINEIRVGTRSMFVQAGEINADLFSADAPIFEDAGEENGLDRLITIRIGKHAESRLGLPIDLPEVLPGNQIIVVASNMSDDDSYFSSAFLGTTRAH